MAHTKRLMFAAAIVASFATEAYAQNFPNLQRAQQNLAEAMASLEQAPQGFGGHKAQAMRHIRAAHREIERAMAFAAERRQRERR